MKFLVTLSPLVFFAICYGADKQFLAACTEDDTCLGGTTCQAPDSCATGFCNCPGLSIYNGSKCNKLRSVGDSCSDPTHCNAGERPITCTGGKCACLEGYSPQEFGNSCAKHVGDSCSGNAECRGGLTMECRDSKCACKGAHTPVSGGTCRQNNFGEKCTKAEECLTKNCINNKCDCPDDQRAHKNGYCIHITATTVGLGAKCDPDFNQVPVLNGKHCADGLTCARCSALEQRQCIKLASYKPPGGSASRQNGIYIAVVSVFVALLHI